MKSRRCNRWLGGAVRIAALALGVIWGVGFLAFIECTPALSAQTEKDKQNNTRGNQNRINKRSNRRGARIAKNRNRNVRRQNEGEDGKVIKVGDAVRDFSTEINPNGVWSYGWSSTESPVSEFIKYT